MISVEKTGDKPVGELTGKQRRYLRGLGNQLKATVYVGKEGITEGILKSIDETYNTGELIKIRIERSCPLDRREAGRQLAEQTQSHMVQVLGQTVLIYRPDPEEPAIVLPT
jgi:RNA-binding protein